MSRNRPRDERHLDRLIDRWLASARPALDGLHAQFGGSHRQRLEKRMAKEVGYRHRLRRIIREDDPRAALGWDYVVVRKTIDALKQASLASATDVFVLPSASDRTLVGPAAYPGANPPNPFQWVPVLARHSHEGDLVWEMGPGIQGSGRWIGEEMNRHVWLVRVPAPGTTDHEFRLPIPHGSDARVQQDTVMPTMSGLPHADINDVPPALVLVHLPVPVDCFSIADFATHHIKSKHKGERLFGIRPDQQWLDLHPELALSTNAYLDGVVERLEAVARLVCPSGTRVCVATPMVAGTNAAVEKTIRRRMSWRVVERITAFEQGGMWHYWNGTSLVGTALTVWGAP